MRLSGLFLVRLVLLSAWDFLRGVGRSPTRADRPGATDVAQKPPNPTPRQAALSVPRSPLSDGTKAQLQVAMLDDGRARRRPMNTR